jgi:uncharacterized protein YuzE
MRVTYDPEADAIYIELRRGEPVDTRDLEEGVTVDLDANGRVIGLEVLDVRERLGVESAESISLEVLTSTLRKTA